MLAKEHCFNQSHKMGSSVYWGRTTRGVATCLLKLGLVGMQLHRCVARCVWGSFTLPGLIWSGIWVLCHSSFYENQKHRKLMCVFQGIETSLYHSFPILSICGLTWVFWTETSASAGHGMAEATGKKNCFAWQIFCIYVCTLSSFSDGSLGSWLGFIDCFSDVTGGGGEDGWKE